MNLREKELLERIVISTGVQVITKTPSIVADGVYYLDGTRGGILYSRIRCTDALPYDSLIVGRPYSVGELLSS